MDYTALGLNEQLRPENSPAVKNLEGAISAYDFNSTNERGAITTSFLSSIKNTAGSVIMNALGLTAANFITGYTEIDSSSYGSTSINPGTIPSSEVSFILKKKVVGLFLTTIRARVNNIGASALVQINIEKSVDGTTYITSGSNNEPYFTLDYDPYSNNTLWYMEELDGSGSYNYWRANDIWYMLGTVSGSVTAANGNFGYVLLGS